jgi:hypothetical protein
MQVINDKDQQTRELVEIVLSITAQTSEMDCAEYKAKKRVEMDFSMTMQDPVEWVMAKDIVLLAVLKMMLQMSTILCPTLTSCGSLPACPGVRSHPYDEEVAPPVSRETVIYTRQLHHIADTACQAAAITKKLILLLMIQPAKQRP